MRQASGAGSRTITDPDTTGLPEPVRYSLIERVKKKRKPLTREEIGEFPQVENTIEYPVLQKDGFNFSSAMTYNFSIGVGTTGHFAHSTSQQMPMSSWSFGGTI